MGGIYYVTKAFAGNCCSIVMTSTTYESLS